MAAFTELEGPLRRLLEKYGPPRRSHHPEYPFWRLQADDLWEISDAGPLIRRKGHADPRKRELVDKNVSGGLPEDVFDLLKSDRRFLGEIIDSLTAAHFPASVSEELLSELGLAEIELASGSIPRDAAFRGAVIQAYEHRCAVCGYDTRFGQSDLGLAAHIKWCQAGGPDVVKNGLALCVLHHRAFDRGAIGLDDNLTILISADVFGCDGTHEWFFRFNGKSLRMPQSTRLAPARRFIEWHRNEVFRTPVRG